MSFLSLKFFNGILNFQKVNKFFCFTFCITQKIVIEGSENMLICAMFKTKRSFTKILNKYSDTKRLIIYAGYKLSDNFLQEIYEYNKSIEYHRIIVS